MAKEDYKGIWIFAEQENGIIDSTVFELIAKAKQLQSHSNERITAVLLGNCIGKLPDKLFEYGADEVIIAQNKALERYSARPYQKALTQLAQKYRPSIILYGATAIGRDLAPRMMVSLNTGLTADAIDLSYDEDGVFCQTTPAYGGKILAHIAILESRPQMATVHPQICEPLTPNPGALGTLIVETVEVDFDEQYEVLEVGDLETTERSPADSPIVVSGGRGIKSQEDLEMLCELAAELDGEIACSRPLVDNGWLAHNRQIGQSGLTLAPNLIINIAISGSVQYVLGMQKSKCIVAINQSPDAPIFDLAHYGVVADYRKIIPALIQELRNRI